jgi:hypothetical protein
LLLDVLSGGVRDIAQNLNADFVNMGVNVTEIEDNRKPLILSAEINLGTGVIVIHTSETIDVTPISLVDLTKIRLGNATADTTVALSAGTSRYQSKEHDAILLQDAVTGTAAVQAVDDPYFLTVTLTLTEVQRVAALVLSGTPGGDGGALFLDVDQDGVQDIATNKNEDSSVQVVETADTIVPVFTSAQLNYSTGELRITADEILDVTPASLAVLNKIFLTNPEVGGLNVVLDGSVPNHNRWVDASETTYATSTAQATEVEALTVQIMLSEQQRVAALEISGQPGGDSTAVSLTIDAGGLRDMAGNLIADTTGVSVAEIADLVHPTVASAAIDLNNGILRITASETIDTTPASNVKLPLLWLVNVSGSQEVTEINLDGYLPHYGTWRDAQLDYQQNATATTTPMDGLTVRVTLTEPQRAAAIARSGTPGGDGGALVLDS